MPCSQAVGPLGRGAPQLTCAESTVQNLAQSFRLSAGQLGMPQSGMLAKYCKGLTVHHAPRGDTTPARARDGGKR